MNAHIKNLQNNALLYGLSLAVGSSLDTYRNCQHFIQVLVELKKLPFAAVWMKNTIGEPEPFCCADGLNVETKVLPVEHFIVKKLAAQPSFTLSPKEVGGVFLPEKIDGTAGTHSFFRLGELGFLHFFSHHEKGGFLEKEMAQLKEVVQKFSISLEGCEAHRLLREETERRDLMQKALKAVNLRVRESENKLRQIIDYSLDAVVNIDAEGRVVEWSKQAESMFGLLREEAVGDLVKDLIVPRMHHEAFEKSLAYFRRTGQGAMLNKRIEITALWKQRRPFPIELSISVLRNENGDLLSGIIRDLTERKRSEAALASTQLRLNSLLANLQAGILLENENREIVLANQYFCRVFNIPSEPAWLVGKNGPDTLRRIGGQFEEADSFSQQINELPKKAELVVGETLHLSDGRVVERDFVPLFSEKKYLGHLWQYRDVTARWQAQREAEQAREAERQFLANMSHEIRTPMNAVIGMSHLLVETELTAKQKDYLTSLRFSADSLMGIINDILDLSKIEADELEFEEKQFDLGYLLDSLRRTFQFKVREKPISVDFELDSGIKNLVGGDPTRLNQILTNLLGNASKFTKKGSIRLRTKVLKNTPEKYEVEFRVKDTGIGIARENLSSIFQNFKQANVKVARKFGGTGLGLTIVKQLVERQGGHIRVESELGKGSEFIFVLPFKNSGQSTALRPVKKKEVIPDTPSFFKELHLLIAEDNKMNQKLIGQIMEMWGCQYDLANDGMEALLVSRAKPFDLILMDIHMPEMDGVEATRKIRSEAANLNQKTPIVALTAAALMEEKKRGLESGMNDFLTKPFSPQKLKACIVGFLKDKYDLPVAAEVPAPSPSPTDDLQVDLKYLFDFSGGDRHFVTDMIETFLREAPASLEKLTLELEQENWPQVRTIVHTMKPNFMMLGMEKQRAEAAQAEAMIKAGEVGSEKLSGLVAGLVEAARSAFPLLEEKLEVI